MSLNPLIRTSLLKINEFPKQYHFDNYGEFFPFPFDQGSGLHIGYQVLQKESKFIDNYLSENFVREAEQIQINSAPFIEHFFGQFRLYEVYFEKPNFTVIHQYEDIILGSINPKTGQQRSIDDKTKKFIRTDGVLGNFIGMSSLILFNPSKYIKGVCYKDYDVGQLEDYRHLIKITY